MQSQFVRLPRKFVAAAAAEGARHHRSSRQQLEHWVELGRLVDGIVGAEAAYALRLGILELRSHHTPPTDPNSVMEELEERRPTLKTALTRARVRYQASRKHPGCLERVDAEGEVVVGKFRDGEFVPLL